MLDIGWSELLLIGVVALVVIGPEDLPKLFHTLGRLTARARGMAREFTSAMEEAARGSGLDDAAKGLRDVSSLTSKNNRGLQALDRAVTRFEKWDPKIATGGATTGIQPDPAAPKPAAPKAGAAPQAPAASNTAAAPTAAAPTAATTAPAAATPGPRQGGRRLAGVRRSDMKDQ